MHGATERFGRFGSQLQFRTKIASVELHFEQQTFREYWLLFQRSPVPTRSEGLMETGFFVTQGFVMNKGVAILFLLEHKL